MRTTLNTVLALALVGCGAPAGVAVYDNMLPDSGVDAGVPDPSDSGADGDATDASLPDAGGTDAGGPDASDAGMTCVPVWGTDGGVIEAAPNCFWADPYGNACNPCTYPIYPDETAPFCQQHCLLPGPFTAEDDQNPAYKCTQLNYPNPNSCSNSVCAATIPGTPPTGVTCGDRKSVV